MTPGPRELEQVQEWMEKASRRLAECQAEIDAARRDLAHARVAKLRRRSERYRILVSGLKDAADRLAASPRSDRENLSRELDTLRERLHRSALALIHAREEWRELCERFEELPGNGKPDLPAPPPDAPEERRAAHDLLRRLLR